jgi:hypothetical protein
MHYENLARHRFKERVNALRGIPQIIARITMHYENYSENYHALREFSENHHQSSEDYHVFWSGSCLSNRFSLQ